MYERILVPLDGSPLAEQVLPYVRILARTLQAPIDLLRVFDPVDPRMVHPEYGLYLDRLTAAFSQEAQSYLTQVRLYLQDLGVAVSTTVHEGDPASHIINEGEKTQGTLIAMSTHGRSGVTRWVLGSVADKVLHATTNPLLIIRARPLEGFSPDTLPTRTERWAAVFSLTGLTVPLDGSALAEHILPHVVALAKGLNLRVNLVRVTPSARSDARAREYLHQVSERLRQEGAPAVEERLLHGDAASAIVGLVENTRDNLVPMTTRGLSGAGRWVLGSVTDRVVRYSGNPVLVIRGA